MIYFLEGFIFLLTGLQVRAVIERANSFAIGEIVRRAYLIVAVVIVARVHLGVSRDLSAALAVARRWPGAIPPRPGNGRS